MRRDPASPRDTCPTGGRVAVLVMTKGDWPDPGGSDAPMWMAPCIPCMPGIPCTPAGSMMGREITPPGIMTMLGRKGMPPTEMGMDCIMGMTAWPGMPADPTTGAAAAGGRRASQVT